ncbi:hypothetical protein ACTWP5_17710 [Streptomyces sp. 4N509B]|uniref:hypothetical protein n=1 Tax=Streptomyces sp. 4N509B TaxID=3457413 RepID=UPI003FD2D28F
MPVVHAPTTVPRKRLPAGMPREWYVAHNRMLKAMRLATALLEAGVYTPQQAGTETIRRMAERIGVHPPSSTTCRLVHWLLWSSDPRSRLVW